MRATVALAVAAAGLWRGCQALRVPEPVSEKLEAANPESADISSQEEPGPAPAFLSNHTLAKIREHAGLYVDKSAHPEHRNAILVTASNIAYADMLKNWRCQADKLGLDYLVIAFDPELLKVAGSKHTVLADGLNGHYYPEHARFREGHFNEISCLKVRMVQQIMRLTGLNIVFSDPDNVFRKDPFSRSASLGSKMLSGKYDYIYQQNNGWAPNRSNIGAEVEEGNTGFYFVSPRKQKGVQALFESALTECRNNRLVDDQSNFWGALRKIRGGKGRAEYGPNNFACADLCGRGPTCPAPRAEVLSYCEMDPYSHITGWEISDLPQQDQQAQVATYHSNWCRSPEGVLGGMDKKIEKLARNGFWHDECAGQWSMVARQHSGGRKIPLQHVRYEGRDGQED